MNNIAKAIAAGLTTASLNLMAQPGFASAWHVVWTTVLAYAVGHTVVWSVPNRQNLG